MKMMCEKTYKWLNEPEEIISQSVGRVLKTEEGSQILNRSFGSEIHQYIGKSEDVAVDVSQECFIALDKWLPEFQPINVETKSNKKGLLELEIFTHGGSYNVRIP